MFLRSCLKLDETLGIATNLGCVQCLANGVDEIFPLICVNCRAVGGAGKRLAGSYAFLFAADKLRA